MYASTAFANSTNVTINANVTSFVVLRLENDTNQIVSDDDTNPSASGPGFGNEEILDFGDIDSLGYQSGTFNSGNALPPSSTVIQKQKIIAGSVDTGTANFPTDPVNDGTIYYMAGGYQLRGLRNDAPGATDMDIDVMVSAGANTLPAVVDFQAAAYNNSDTPSIWANDGLDHTLNATMPLNNPQPITLGVFVPLGQAAGATSTVITFTGT